MNVPGFGAPPAPAKRRGCLSVLVISGSLLGLCCCCLSGLLVVASEETTDTSLLGSGEEKDLGTVLVPATAPLDRAEAYHWPMDRARYAFTYGIDEAVRRKIDARHDALARRMGFVNGERGLFRWTPPPECEPTPWECVYHSVTRDNRASVAPIAEAFTEYQKAQQLEARALIELVVSWVQHISYRLPDDENFGVLPPTRVAAEGWGDCDSKALLAALVLDELGVETVVLHSEALKHAALGVELPGEGPRFKLGGKRYLYVEVTSPGWKIGTIPPEVSATRLWEVMTWK